MSDDRAALAAAIDRWIFDLNDDDHELRRRLRDVKAHLERSTA